MPARKTDFIPEPAEKTNDESDRRIEAAKTRRESELRTTEILQFERGYN
jgi:hypothetical protein